MLLLIDAGNTRIKWALLEHAARETSALGHWTGYGSVRREDLHVLGESWRGVDVAHVLISNVAGQAMRDGLESALGMRPIPVSWFASVAQSAGVRNHYQQAGQLGSDRFAAAIGAHALFPAQPLIIATCGTATTVDGLSAEGDFLGGMILPGLALMTAALARGTAQLPQVSPAQAKERESAWQPFADHTDAAIFNGCLAAQVGAIERAVAAHPQASADSTVQCIVSGGAAHAIAPHLSVACHKVDNLVLIGLQVVAAQTQ